MTGSERVVLVAALFFLLLGVRGNDADVSCVFLESCMLPCTFPPGDDVLIHWIQLMDVDVYVHSYYENKDQLDKQDQRFRNRTSLFKSQISRGNASLLLRGVEVQDQGRYKCYPSTSSDRQHSIMTLKVEAPVRKVHIQQVGDQITCSSEGIYPKPELTWSTRTPETTSSVHQTEQQLYSIRSSLVVADQNYSCIVRTPTSQRRATWFQPTSINSPDSEVTISCTSTKTPLTGLIWRFNLTDLILNQTRTKGSIGSDLVSEGWRQKVENVSESGSLTLHPPLQEGMYTCEVSDDEETYITNHHLRVQDGPGSENVPGWGIAVIVLGILLAIAVAGAIARKCYIIQQEAADARQGAEAAGQGAADAGQGGADNHQEAANALQGAGAAGERRDGYELVPKTEPQES